MSKKTKKWMIFRVWDKERGSGRFCSEFVYDTKEEGEKYLPRLNEIAPPGQCFELKEVMW